jgi:hypothetical protein
MFNLDPDTTHSSNFLSYNVGEVTLEPDWKKKTCLLMDANLRSPRGRRPYDSLTAVLIWNVGDIACISHEAESLKTTSLIR